MQTNVFPNNSEMEQPIGKKGEYEDGAGKGWALTLLLRIEILLSHASAPLTETDTQLTEIAVERMIPIERLYQLYIMIIMILVSLKELSIEMNLNDCCIIKGRGAKFSS